MRALIALICLKEYDIYENVFKDILRCEFSVSLANISRRFSSSNLNLKLVDFLTACNLYSVIGSIRRSCIFFTLLKATYVIPGDLSDDPKSIQALERVRP